MQVPLEVPVMTLGNAILFPQAMLPLHIFEPRYRKMLADVLAGSRVFAVALRRGDRVRETPASVAGLGLVRACVTRPDGTSNLILQGLARIRLGRAVQYRPYRIHTVQPLPPAGNSGLVVQALTLRVLELAKNRLQQGMHSFVQSPPEPPGSAPLTLEAFQQALEHLAQLDDAEQLTDLVSATLLRDPRQRQIILETPRLEDRLRYLVRFLQSDTEESDDADEE
jgi:Lon protease-like protein